MKPIVTLLATLCLLQSSHAATAVPDAISYQGRALTATGALMGAGTPVNRTVVFRIWDHSSNSLEANLIYSEQQVVTIAEGEFSVLVGTGAATANTPLGYSETTKGPPALKISDAFGGENRYLGVTIDDGTAVVDNEISPRQQIVSGAFALRSKFAESIGSASDLTLTPLSGTASNYGLGWYGIDRLFGTTAVDGPVLYGNSGGALGSNASGSQKLALSWDASGRVGIGATSITSLTNKLTLEGDYAGGSPADHLTIRGSTDKNKRLNIGYSTGINVGLLQSYTAASTTGPLLLNPSGGNVGVNNTGPSVALDVTGAIKASTSIAAGTGITAGAGGVISNGGIQSSNNIVAGTSIAANGNNGYVFNGTGDAQGGLFSPADNIVTLRTNNIERMRVDALGNVGIGATPANEARLVIKGQTSARRPVNGTVAPYGMAVATWNLYAGNQYDSVSTFQDFNRYLSIHADNGIQSAWAIFYSDERIKRVVGRSNPSKDLATLQGIEVTDYFYKDVVQHGVHPQKKVIAQQVERVFPQAVSRSTMVVPDILEEGAFRDGWVILKTDLKAGDRVRLITDSEEGVHDVLEAKGDSFRTAFKAAGDKVFVYGREVNDFRSVDYDAISMLNVSATQQIKREKDAEIQTLRDENAALRRELAAKDASLAAKDASLETRLIALERRMSAEVATETVSLKTAQAVK